MKVKSYLYKGVDYFTEDDVRKAIFEHERIAFGKVDTEEGWLLLGVQYEEKNIEPPLEELKKRKLSAVKESFLNWRKEEATLNSSLGFEVDSTDRANSDVAGLLVAYENNADAEITFRGANNEFHKLTYDQVKTLQREIVENGCFAYEQKWEMDAMVEVALSKEDIDKISTKFYGKNFFKED